MIKAIFFDVDGTILSHKSKQVPKSTREALDLLKEKGIKRVLATGRHISEIDYLPLNDIKFDGYLTLNGQLCLDANRNVIFSQPISKKSKEIIVKMFNEKRIPILLLEKEKMYINYNDEYVEFAQKAISTPLPTVGTYQGEDIYQVIGFVSEKQQDEVFSILDDCEITRWNKFGCDIIASGGGKAKGIAQYLTTYGIDRKESMAFGDGENDIEMLNYVQIGIAMANGEEIVKENAEYVTDSVDDDGIMKALKQFKILE